MESRKNEISGSSGSTLLASTADGNGILFLGFLQVAAMGGEMNSDRV